MKLSFHINFHTVWGQKLYITGSIPELGNWEPVTAKEMIYAENGNWQLVIEISPSHKSVEYRYMVMSDDGHFFEEWERNHNILLEKPADLYTLYDCWQERPADITYYSSAFTNSIFAHKSNCYTKDKVCCSKKLTIKISAPHIEQNQNLAITGNQDRLGNWNIERALILDCENFPEWSIDLNVEDIHYPLEYKFLVIETETNKLVCWESGENRNLNIQEHNENETVSVSGLFFRGNLPAWNGAGTVIPVFSLRSKKSFGIGDLGDLHLFIDWIKQTGQRFIQVLPINDTITNYSWKDSYPYNAISIYALHPIYICLSWLGGLEEESLSRLFEDKREELNALSCVDYEEVISWKIKYCHTFFLKEGEKILNEDGFKEFFASNSEWLIPYAAYSWLRDKYGTADFSKWENYAIYNRGNIRELCSSGNKARPEISFYYFLQYILHTQFRKVTEYARANGIVLKGDLPIGVNRNSVEVWTEPRYFNLDGQTGAPPDDFSLTGQNWSFPTYNWERMEQDRFAWWKKRFAKLGDYFDCFRIDHILGFFRIWEIPLDYRQGLCGHFNPSLPMSKDEIEQYGIVFNESRFTTPHINMQHLGSLFGQYVDEALDACLAQSSSNHCVLKPFCNTQAKIEGLFSDKKDEKNSKIRNGLLYIANETLFIRDPYMTDHFHPRISAWQSHIYSELSESDRTAFDHLYTDFFYRRHNDFWKEKAYQRLTPLIFSTGMLPCGEDLGMIPDSVPEVMSHLKILSLEIERMPKSTGCEFADLNLLPYLSVCTTSTHDMSPIRNWWAEEDSNKIQRYYNNVLHLEGKAPQECTPEIAELIIKRHLEAPSMLVIIPLQDWFSMNKELRRNDFESERINIPSNPSHYWQYRMHLNIEDLLAANNLNSNIKYIINNSGRK